MLGKATPDAVASQTYALRLDQLPDEMRDDADTVRSLVNIDGCCLQFASDRIKDDANIVGLAVSNHGYAVRYASSRLRADKDIAIRAVTNYGIALRFLDTSLQANPEVVVAAHVRCWHALEYCDPNVLTDRELMRKVLSVNGYAIALMPADVASDPDMLAVAQHTSPGLRINIAT